MYSCAFLYDGGDMSYGVRGDETKRRSVGISIMQMVVDSGVYCGLCKLLKLCMSFWLLCL